MPDPHIYKLTLLRDIDGYTQGQVYVGQSNGNKRGYVTGGVIPSKLIKLHGKGLFKKVVLTSGYFDRETLNRLEKYYIKFYSSDTFGLNITAGGKGDGSINLVRPVYQYGIDGVYIKKYNSVLEASKEFDTEAIYDAVNPLRPVKTVGGFQWRYDKLDFIPPYRNNKFVDVNRYTKEGEYIDSFKSIQEAHRVTGINPNTIENAFFRESGFGGGFQWRAYKVDNCGQFISTKGKHNIRPVDMLSLSGEFIRTFSSISEATQFFNSKSVGIRKVLTLPDRKTAFGYRWQYTKLPAA